MKVSVLALLFAAAGIAAASRRRSNCNGFRANPSVYNFEIGGRPAKVISDGRLLFDNVTDTYAEPAFVVERALRLNYQSFAPIIFENNMLYVDLGKKKLLFDTGNSFLQPETAGFLFDNLNAEGIHRWSITDIFINHAHFDHIGGLLLPNGRTPAFPGATVHINRKEFNFWTAPTVDLSQMDLPPASIQFLKDSARTVFNIVKGQVKLFDDGDRILPEVTAVETSWHTPGHTSYMINVEGDKLFYSGDAFGIESTSINNPWFRLRFDLNREESVVGRVKLLESLSKSEIPIVDYHASFPGIGRVVRNDLAFDFKPVNWEFEKGVNTKCYV